jgi:Trypsin-like peptidase domain/TPR repeat
MSTKYCGRCGAARVSDDDFYCRECGAALDVIRDAEGREIPPAPGVRPPLRPASSSASRPAQRFWMAAALVAAAALVLTLLPHSVYRAAPHAKSTAANPAATKAQDLTSLIQRVRPAVVTVIVYDQRGKELGFGSGFFISRGGELLTNHHVIEGASSARIRTFDGRTWPLRVILADDKGSDLARLVAFMDAPVSFLSMASKAPRVGDRVLVIGSPMGLDETVTDGIVSAVPAEREGKSDLEPATLQVTAAISEGSSGGPVVDALGEVIGVATAYMSEGENLGFAVPLARIKTLARGTPRTFAQWRHPRRRPSPIDLYYDGLAMQRTGDCASGLGYFRRALAADPKLAQAWWGRGLCLVQQGAEEDAQTALDRAVALNPEFADAHYDLGRVYADEGQSGLAAREYGVLKKLSPDLARKLKSYMARSESHPLADRESPAR